ncbi:branched-chain amino acid ABC transporter substrate-binding protein [Burkholderia ubonensis]|uniref:branched-chain amino acid ABC transporter substrate-binding protein n=1 Tax=Burkholderia ubonensis TaxID=101571 RepID=UPI00075F217E|nr:branched chain amino acid ABC transporter substrate-binding protein [Burkholderia ubonensis]KUZ12184.1 branched chain amino acid ABC transporter substrate-binding protein [Burkholderia ubonensis]KUZ35387.1 branched chain amino acid ABC transporter substrate-binding protein [Burkholderia ubonensis]KUZ38910.1 branched chain amino acid ABC transporter substrate-binding protein [Burkholderia ubonensis]KUZ45373.1 branched chain amino acid ABC transporter substrate-binding protein [Burkholderia ub
MRGFRRSWLAMGLSAVTLCFACGPSYGQQVVRIGASSPLTGISASNGKDLENGVRLAVEEANAQHIKLGGQEVRFELDSVDDQGDPRIGVQVAQKLVDDGVAAVVGYYNSGVALPSAPIFAKAGIPLIDPAATNPAITRQGLKTVFRIIATDAQNSGVAGTYAVNVTKAQRIAVMDDRTAFGQGAVEEFKKAVAAAGGKIVAAEFTNDKAVEFNAQLTNIKAANADLLYFGGLDNQAALITKRMRQLGMRVQFVGSGGIADSIFINVAGSAAEGAMAWEYGRPIDSLPQGKAFARKFKNRFGVDMLTYSPFAYDCVGVIVHAMRQANSATPAEYLPALRATRYEGITGKIAFDANGDLEHPTSTLYQVKGGRWVPVTTIGAE